LVPSSDASLSLITFPGFETEPVFSPEVLDYSVQVETDISRIELEVLPANAFATVFLGNTQLVHGEALNLELQPGLNTFDIRVTAQDLVHTRSYQLKITRKEAIFPYRLSFTEENAPDLILGGGLNPAHL